MDSYSLIFSMDQARSDPDRIPREATSVQNQPGEMAPSSQAGPLPIEVEMNLMYQTKPVLGRPWYRGIRE